MNEKVYMTTDATHIKGKTKEYHKQPYSDKFGNLDEMDTHSWKTKIIKIDRKGNGKLKL